MTASKPQRKISLRLDSAGIIPIGIAAVVILGYFFIRAFTYIRMADNTTLADLLVRLRAERLNFVIVVMPVYILFLQMAMRNDFDPNFVLKNNRRRSLWNLHSLKILIYALIAATGVTAVILLTGFVSSCKWINWDSPYSQYFFSQYTVNEDVGFVQVLLAGYASYLLTFFGYGLLFLLFFWLFQNAILPILLTLVVCVWDLIFYYQSYLPDMSLLLDRLAFSFEDWKNGTVFMSVVVGAVFCLRFYLIGSLICEKK